MSQTMKKVHNTVYTFVTWKHKLQRIGTTAEKLTEAKCRENAK